MASENLNLTAQIVMAHGGDKGLTLLRMAKEKRP